MKITTKHGFLQKFLDEDVWWYGTTTGNNIVSITTNPYWAPIDTSVTIPIADNSIVAKLYTKNEKDTTNNSNDV